MAWHTDQDGNFLVVGAQFCSSNREVASMVV